MDSPRRRDRRPNRRFVNARPRCERLEARTLLSGSIPDLPDFALGPGDDAEVVSPGWNMYASVVVTNAGAASGQPRDLSVYLSADEAFDPGDALVATDTEWRWLGPGESQTVWFSGDIPPRAATGAAYLLFVADPRNLIVEADETNNTLARPVTVEVADVTVRNVELGDQPMVGRMASLGWQIEHLGGGQSRSPDVRVYISRDNRIDASDRLLTQDAVFTGFPFGEAVENWWMLPVFEAEDFGERYLIVTANADGAQPESDHTNNTAAVQIRVDAPDLAMTSLTAPSLAAQGGSIELEWEVETDTPGVIQLRADAVYLSDDGELDSGDTRLGWQLVYTPGGESAQLTVDLPVDAIGSKHLIVVADDPSQWFERDEANNTKVRPIEILSVDYATGAASLAGDGPLHSGSVVEVRWTETNIGLGDASRGTDTLVFFSDDPVWDSGDEVLSDLSQWRPPLSPLAAGEVRTGAETIWLPMGSAGTRYVLVVANADRTQGEADFSNNVAAIPVLIREPDLSLARPAGVLAVREGGGPVSWTQIQRGGLPWSSSYTVRGYLSEDDQLSEGDALVFGFDTGASGSDSSQNAEVWADLPPGLAGDRFLIIEVDGADNIPESDETNNRLVVPIHIERPDLRLLEASAPEVLYAGSHHWLGWTLQNLSGLRAQARARFFVSNDPILDAADREAVDAGSYLYEIEPGATRQGQSGVTIPTGITGPAYLLAVADDDLEDLATAHVVSILIHLRVGHDLIFSRIEAPAEIEWDQPFVLSWTVTNIGDEPVPMNSFWSDAVSIGENPEGWGGRWLTRVGFSWDPAVFAATRPIWGGDRSGLAPGESYTISQALTIRDVEPGLHYFHFQPLSTSLGNPWGPSVNDAMAAPVTVLAPGPDDPLVDPVFDELWRDAIDGRLHVSYTNTNNGQGVARGPWTDELFLMREPYDGLDDLVPLATVQREEDLLPRESYSHSLVTESHVPSDYRVWVFAEVRAPLADEALRNRVVISQWLPGVPFVELSLGPIHTTRAPGETLRVPLTLTNLGSGAHDGDLRLEFSLTTDDDGAGDEFLIGSVAIPSTLQPGERATLTVDLVLPADLATGAYHVLARRRDEAAPAWNLEALSDDTVNVAWRFGAFDGRRNVKHTYLDGQGVPVTLSLSKGGYGELTFVEGRPRIVLRDTSASSAFALSAPAGTATSIGGVRLQGPLKSFKATGATLAGDFTAVAGLKTLALGGVNGGAIHLAVTAPAANLTLGRVRNLQLMAEAPVGKLRAIEWIDDDGVADSFSGVRIADAKIDGDFEADVTLSDSTSALGKLTVGGWLDEARIDAVGSLGAVSVGGVRGSRVLLGVESAAADLFDETADFTPNLSALKSLTIRGVAGWTGPTFVDSTIAAAAIGKVKLRTVATANAGAPTGLVASTIRSLQMPAAAGPLKLNDLETGLPVEDGDFRVRLV